MVLSVLHGMVKCLPQNGQRKAADDAANDAHFPSANVERIYERRTKPITSAKRHGWNGHRFLCVPHRSWGFGVVDMKWASDWKEAVAKAEAAEQAATEEKAAAMKKEWFLTSQEVILELSLWGCVCKDSETKKMVIVQSSFWSSFWAAFHFQTFKVCSFSAWYLLLLAHSFWMLLEAWFHADINWLGECLQIQNQANMYIKSHRFLCHPYRSWEFHDHIKYQCPGETVPNGRRFWRPLIWPNDT